MSDQAAPSASAHKVGQVKRKLTDEQQTWVAAFHQDDVELALWAIESCHENEQANLWLDEFLAALKTEFASRHFIAAGKLRARQRTRRRTLERRLANSGAPRLKAVDACFCGEEPPVAPWWLACGHCACRECAFTWLKKEKGSCWMCRAAVPRIPPLHAART